MNKLQIMTAAATLSLLAITGALAESDNGALTHVSSKNRADVGTEAVSTAAAPNQNVARGSRGAVATSHAPDQNVSGDSEYNSRLVSTMARPAPAVQAQQSKARGLLPSKPDKQPRHRFRQTRSAALRPHHCRTARACGSRQKSTWA
jgi:hypothetical protein